MNNQEKRLLENVQKACLWLHSHAPEAYENSGIEPAIRALSAAAAIPEQSSHRERLVEAIAPKAFEYFLAQGRSQGSLASVKAFVGAILEAENATDP
ncbi:MAG: hypothetical protein ACRC62_26480 [Microcoleus sp.]